MRTVSLINLRRAILPPIHVPELGLVEHVVGVTERSRAGAVGRRKLRRRLPAAVTLCAKGTPGDRQDGLPAAAATSREVLAAVKRGDVRVVVSDSPDPPAAVRVSGAHLAADAAPAGEV